MGLKRALEEDSCDQRRSVCPFQQQQTTQSFFNGSEDIPAPFTTLAGTGEQHHLSYPHTQYQYPPVQLALFVANPTSTFNPQVQVQHQHLPSATAPPSISNTQLAAPPAAPDRWERWKAIDSRECVNCCVAATKKCDGGIPCYRCIDLKLQCSYERLEKDKFGFQPKYPPPTTAPPLVSSPQLQPQPPPSATAPSPVSQLEPEHLSPASGPLRVSNPFQSRKKRARASMACNNCREAKAKCDEGAPCSKCETGGYRCTYSGPPPTIPMPLSIRIDEIEKTIDEIPARLKKEIVIVLENEFGKLFEKLREFGSLGRIDELVNSESTVDLSTPQQQEGGHNISPTITPSSPKSAEVAPALHNKSTGKVKVETIQDLEEDFRTIEENPLLDTGVLSTYTQDWWASQGGQMGESITTYFVPLQ